jgi:uridine kinase
MPTVSPTRKAQPGSVLLFDGVFLLRHELRPYWDLTIHLKVGADETLRRAVARDRDLFRSEEVIRLRYTTRYLPGQQIYRDRARPADSADVVIDHDDPRNPVILKWP